MDCPICKKDMKIVKTGQSNNPDTGTRYDRTLFNCAHCDTWINTEIPKS